MFMTPDVESAERLNNFVGYCLGVCLERYGVALHAACVESNHYHANFTDRRGELPAFKATFHGWLARGINALRGRCDRFWSGDEPVDVRPGDPLHDDDGGEVPRTALDDLVYVLTNPVKDGLVRNGGRWLGFTTYAWRFGETRTFKRPDWFFDPHNPDLPDEVSITLERPQDVRPDLDDDELYELLMREVRTREAGYQSKMRSHNRRFMGETKLRKQHWNRAPRSYEERFVVARRVRDPHPLRRRTALVRDRRWRLQYADARARRLRGEEDVVFPHGTYRLRHLAGVRVAQAPP